MRHDPRQIFRLIQYPFAVGIADEGPSGLAGRASQVAGKAHDVKCVEACMQSMHPVEIQQMNIIMKKD